MAGATGLLAEAAGLGTRPYATLADLEAAAGGAERLLQLTDLHADGLIDPEAAQRAQGRADALIDSYASVRYAVPISSPSQAIIQTAADETVFQLKVRRGAATEQDQQERDLRLQWLEALSQGCVGPSDPPPPKSSAVTSKAARSGRDVSREYR